MTEGRINERVVMERASWVLQMIEALHDLPIENREAFFQNRHNIAAAESYLRRALEAFLTLGDTSWPRNSPIQRRNTRRSQAGFWRRKSCRQRTQVS